MCDYPLARNIVLLSVVLASEAVMRFAASGAREGWSATLGDLTITPWRSE